MANPQMTVKIAESGDRAQMTVKIAESGDRAQMTMRVAEVGDQPRMAINIWESGDRAQMTVILEGYNPGGAGSCDGETLDFSCDENSGHAGGTA
jgi:hypothetical protein